jgi:hypothetical protein
MIFVHFAIAAAFCVGAGAFTARAAEADRVDARFEIFGFAGLHVLTNRTSVEETANRYAIATDLDTRGLASVLVDLTSHSEAHGGVSGETLRPDAYRAEVRRNGVERQYRLDYQGDGTVINASMRSSAGHLLLVAAEQVRGTVVRVEIVANPNKNEDTYRRGKVWYARLMAGDRMIPVRMEFETAFGEVKGYLAELRGHGVHLQLMRE